MKHFSFRLDCNGETENVTKHWQFCVGSGHAALAKRWDYMQQLKEVHDELGMERVRFHDIFNDDMNVCPRVEDFLPVKRFSKTKCYNFYQIGKLYDKLLEIGVKPFVEIGFMPGALASGKKTIFHYKGNVTMPKDIGEWTELIKAFAHFLLERYGAEEVRSWYFEVWNEPNLSCFFKGDMNDYYRLYAATVRALKSVDENLIVGGPATTGSNLLDEFIDYCRGKNVPVDFVSTHQYPTDELGHAINSRRLKQLKKSKGREASQSMSAVLQPVFDNVNDFTPELKGYMTREARRAKKQVGSLPLLYTEWSISSNCVAAIHDTVKASSFLVKTVLDNQGIVEGSSYWTFSDIFEELYFFPEPFSGGFGLLTVDGIRKPAFWAFKMLAKLPDTRYFLPITDDDVEITAFKGSDGGVFIMIYAQSFDDEKKEFDVSFTLDNAPEFSCAVAQRINKNHGNPVSIWRGMGSPAVMTKEETEKIKASSLPVEEVVDISFSKGSAEMHMNVSNNEVILLELRC